MRLLLIAEGVRFCLSGVSCFFPGVTFSGVLLLFVPLMDLLTPEVDGATSNFSDSFVIDGDLIKPLAWPGDFSFELSSFAAGVLKVSPLPGVCRFVSAGRLRDSASILLFFLFLKSPSFPSSVEDSSDSYSFLS